MSTLKKRIDRARRAASKQAGFMGNYRMGIDRALGPDCSIVSQMTTLGTITKRLYALEPNMAEVERITGRHDAMDAEGNVIDFSKLEARNWVEILREHIKFPTPMRASYMLLDEHWLITKSHEEIEQAVKDMSVFKYSDKELLIDPEETKTRCNS